MHFISALGDVSFYFPAPHHPWQRGTNENTNGLLREYFPKNTDITDISDIYIKEMVLELNKRPRKCLNWETPYEVYYQKSLHLTWQFKRYKRVKNSINDFIAPEFAKYGINTNQQDIPYISKRGGGIDHKVLEKIFSE